MAAFMTGSLAVMPWWQTMIAAAILAVSLLILAGILCWWLAGPAAAVIAWAIRRADEAEARAIYRAARAQEPELEKIP
jgi:hypothetical protein